MNKERARDLNVVLSSGTTLPVRLSFTAAPPWRIDFESNLLPAGQYQGEDLFDCLASLRLELESVGARILCAGSQRDVYPSGMSRQMAGGRIAYRMCIGEPASTQVDILDAVQIEGVTSDEEQKEYYKKWQESMMNKSH
jgi:hypothetical protein